MIEVFFAFCQELQELDISDNAIVDATVVAELVDSLPKLKLLNVDGNPCCRDDTEVCQTSISLVVLNNPHYLQQVLRTAFLSKVKQIEYLGAPLRYLNGSLITVAERIRALELSRRTGFDEAKIRIFRTELSLEAVRAEPDATRLMIGGFELKSLTPLTAFKFLEILDLSNNALESLVDQGLSTLENLFWLDLRKNAFISLSEHVLKPLTYCHKLKHLYLQVPSFAKTIFFSLGMTMRKCILQHATKTGETTRVADYLLNPVCHTLRGIESCDQTKNPIKLNADGDRGAEYLHNRYGLSRNGLLHIDLNGRDLDERELPRFCTALSMVYCEKLRCADNPWYKATNYRFLLIFFCKTLIELDGNRVEMDERANAQRIISSMKLDKKLFALERAAYGAYMVVSVLVAWRRPFLCFSSLDDGGCSTTHRTSLKTLPFRTPLLARQTRRWTQTLPMCSPWGPCSASGRSSSTTCR